MRYIDADKILYTDLSEGRGVCWVTFMDWIKEMPTADVRENVRGEWIFHKSTIEGADDSRECSVCGVWLNWTMPRNSFCPNCGADMRERGGE